MDLLLQAARVLEQESDGPDRVSSKSTRGPYIQQHGKHKNENSESPDASQLYSENGLSPDDDGSLFAERTSRRLGGVGTREVHNQLEKNRRKQLREFFNHLQQCVPSLENKRVATQSILQGAIKHIKNLKKKDVEQEREIQMLANRKCELKKRCDLEFNKCTEEQQRMAQVLLKVISSKTDLLRVQPDGHASDSTSTASEGSCNDEDFSDGEEDAAPQSVKGNMPAGIGQGRRRKLSPRTNSQHGTRMSESSSGISRSGGGVVSSSSVALKHMLEQRKRNQTAAGQGGLCTPSYSASDVPSEQMRVQQIPAAKTRGPGRLTYSYPMITTHLASAVRPSASTSGHGVAPNSQLTLQSSLAAVDNAMPSASTSPCHPIGYTSSSTGAARRSKKTVHLRSKGGSLPHTHHSPDPPLHVVSSTPFYLSAEATLKVTRQSTLFPAGMMLGQPSAMSVKLPEPRKGDSSFPAPTNVVTSVSNMDVQGFRYLGSQPGALTLESPTSGTQPSDMSMLSTKVLPTVIPFSLASIIRGMPVSSGLHHVVALSASSALAVPSSAGLHPVLPMADVTGSTVFSNNLQLSHGTNYLLTATTQPTTHHSSLSTTNARIATLLAAPSSHINNIIKSASPLSTICPTSIAIPVTPSLVPVSLASGMMATNSSSAFMSGPPLRILTPLSQSAMMTGSSLMPAVVQLEASGQVALLHNLIPSHSQQHIVVMATGGSDFGTSSSTVTTSS